MATQPIEVNLLFKELIDCGLFDQEAIEFQLSKVKNPKRREWLKKVFRGRWGYEKFLRLMMTRKGAHEFTTGEWKRRLPRYTSEQLQKLKRPCIGGCGFMVPPRFTPWGEVFDKPTTSICPSCKTKVQSSMTTEKKDNPLTRIQDLVAQIEAEKESLKSDLKILLDEAKTKLNVLTSPQLGFTFEDIFSDKEFSEIVSSLRIQVDRPIARPRGTLTGPVRGRKLIKVAALKKGGKKGVSREARILELMKDGKERTEAEIVNTLELTQANVLLKAMVKKGLLKGGGGRGAKYSIAVNASK